MYQLLKTGDSYGIRAFETQVPDISTDREKVLALLKRMEDNEMAEIHIYDVIEDWFGEDV